MGRWEDDPLYISMTPRRKALIAQYLRSIAVPLEPDTEQAAPIADEHDEKSTPQQQKHGSSQDDPK